MNDAVQVVRTARRHLQEHGWIQGLLHEDQEHPTECAACLMGAIDVGAYYSDLSDSYVDTQVAWAEAIEAVGQITHCEVTIWNDARGRTVEQVIAVLNQAEQILLTQ